MCFVRMNCSKSRSNSTRLASNKNSTNSTGTAADHHGKKRHRYRRLVVDYSYLWLVGNGGMGYNDNYYYYHSSIPY